MKAVIAGGGIGGLTAALCLHNFGWDVEIAEQACEIGEVGAGIQISPNGFKVLRALDIDKKIMASGFNPRAAQLRMGQSGRVLFTNSISNYEQRFGAPYLHIHRADLIAVLRDAVEARLAGAIKTAKTITGYGQDDGKAWAKLDDGSRLEGDLVIGADGIKSAIREQMLGVSQPHFTGNIAWRAVVPASKLGRNIPLPVTTIWLGDGKHAVTYLLRGGKLANFVGVVEQDGWQHESWTYKGCKQEALADFTGWHPVITTMLEQAEDHYKWALFDREPLSQWVDGRVALLGDAAHPMLPFMAQGAVQAIEDGYVMAKSLVNSDSIADGLASYFRQRRDRTARVQMAARKNQQFFHQHSSIGKLANLAPLSLASKIAPDIADDRLEWLYGHDVTM